MDEEQLISNCLVQTMEGERVRFEQALRDKLKKKASVFQTEETELLHCFKHFDSDNDGYVTLAEWRKTIEKAGVVSPAEELFDCYDPTHSGKLEYRLFIDVVLRQAPLPYSS